MKKSAFWILLSTIAIFQIALIFTIFGQVKSKQKQILNDRFYDRTDNFLYSFNQRILRNETILQGCKGFVNASTYVSKDEWSRFISYLSLPEHFPAIRWISLASVCQDSKEMDAFIKEFQEKESSQFKVWPNTSTPAAVLKYIFPKNFEELVGYNMYNAPHTLSLLQNPSQMNGVQIRPALNFSPAKKSPSLFLFLLSTASSLQQTSPTFWIVASIDLFTMIDDTSKGLSLDGINIQIYEGKKVQADHLIFERKTILDPTPMASLQKEVRIGSESWTFLFTTTPRYRESAQSALAYWILLGLIVVSFVPLFFLYRFCLSFSGANLPKWSLDQLPQALIGINLQAKVEFCNQNAKKSLGYPPEENLENKPLSCIIDPAKMQEKKDQLIKELGIEISSPEQLLSKMSETHPDTTHDCVFLGKDQKQCPLKVRCKPIQTNKGEKIGYLLELDSNQEVKQNG